MLIKYSGKYVKIYFNMKITFHGLLGSKSGDLVCPVYLLLFLPEGCHPQALDMFFIGPVVAAQQVV